MIQDLHSRRFMMDTPSNYLIRVVGELDKRWLNYFDELSIVVSTRSGHVPVSTICTHGADQATVIGLLNSLYDFGYPLVYFEQVGTPV
jgi:hypothetical protein